MKRNDNTRGYMILQPLLLVAMLAGAVGLRSELQSTRQYQASIEITDAMREETNSSPFAVILGEVRATMADLMWVKTERYLHNGIAYGAHMDTEEIARKGEVHSHDGHGHEHGHGHSHDHDNDHHEHVSTLIPEAQSDYRGFMGTIHRELHPWQDPTKPHVHSTGEQLLPWFRVLTLSDPNHWRGYMIGSWTLSNIENNPEALNEALAFIEEGIGNNPQVFQLPLMKGRLLNARQDWEAAIDAFDRATKLALEDRPGQISESSETWSESDEEDFAMAVRYPVMLCLRKLDRPQEAWMRLQHALQWLPNDRPLNNLQAELTPKSI